jgi:hypothetical protein
MKPTSLLLLLSLLLLSLSSFLVVGPSAAAFACGKLIVTYDAQKNESQVQLRPLIIEGVFQTAPGETRMGENALPNDAHGVALTSLYSYPGRTPSQPQEIIIVVESESANPAYEDDRKLSLNIDGAVLELGIPERGVTRTNMGLTREDLSVRVSCDQFLKFVGAKKAKLSLGSRTFTLTQCHMEALRKFARSIPT